MDGFLTEEDWRTCMSVRVAAIFAKGNVTFLSIY